MFLNELRCKPAASAGKIKRRPQCRTERYRKGQVENGVGHSLEEQYEEVVQCSLSATDGAASGQRQSDDEGRMLQVVAHSFVT